MKLPVVHSALKISQTGATEISSHAGEVPHKHWLCAALHVGAVVFPEHDIPLPHTHVPALHVSPSTLHTID